MKLCQRDRRDQRPYSSRKHGKQVAPRAGGSGGTSCHLVPRTAPLPEAFGCAHVVNRHWGKPGSPDLRSRGGALRPR